MAKFLDLIASFDSNAGKRGKQFEHFIKWFLLHDPEWSTQVDQVWLWEEYPDRWGVDCGVDLVFRHKNGEAWAVQAKCYSQQHDITKHDVDKFLSESNRKEIDKRLLIATTDRMGANAKQVCKAQEKNVFWYLLSNFESANIEYPVSLAELHTAKRKPKPAPREHQIEAIGAVVNNFQDVDRGQLVMACGTGKTFTTLWIKEKLQAKSTLILLPSLGLLSQTLHEWTLAANQPFDVLCVCSDETVGKKGADKAIHSVTDVAFPVTSNVEEIRKFLQRDGAKVVFSTYQSSPLVADAQSVATVRDFDLVIADEAHRCAGKVGNDFTTVLDSKLIRASKRLFTTATPRTYSTNVKKAAGERGIDVVGMDDEAVFGKVLHSLPFGEAIKRGLLTDYQVVIIGVDNPTISAWIENRELVTTESGIEKDAESLAAQIGLLKAYKDYDLRRVISFHSRVSRAEAFTKDIQLVRNWVSEERRPTGNLKADFVSGLMPTGKRRMKLDQLRSIGADERGLLTNARCLSEGVDVPSLDGVAFIDPRSSQIDIIQAVGRAIRLSANKKAGTIILPVFIGRSDDPEQALEHSNFKPIWDVLNALKAHDDVLADELNQIRTELGRKGRGKVDPNAFSKVTFDLPITIDSSFGDGLRTLLVEQVTASWEFWYGLLERYFKEHGDCFVPATYITPNGYKLGVWITTIRSRKHRQSAEQVVRLENIPTWSWDVRNDQWDIAFEYLLKYEKTHGTSLVPSNYKLDTGLALGTWLTRQRGDRDNLTSNRRKKLESLSDWSWDPMDEQWEAGFERLKDYCAQYQDCLVPQNYKTDDGFALGRWVLKQRTIAEKISLDRRKKLENLTGWIWNLRDAQWSVGFEHARSYGAAHGNTLIPDEYVTEDGYKLGAWVVAQRMRREKYTSERIEMIQSLPQWSWDPRRDQWNQGFYKLRELVLEKGSSMAKQGYVLEDGFKLGTWVSTQRTAYKKDRLTGEQIELLQSLPEWTWGTRKET
jgi:superfamily II DNA or RNA helicase